MSQKASVGEFGSGLPGGKELGLRTKGGFNAVV